MAITCTEDMLSRESTSGDGASATRKYTVMGTADHSDALTAVVGASPATHGSLVRRSYSANPVFVDINDAAHSIWAGEVRYGIRVRNPAVGDSTFSFDTGGGTQHITQARPGSTARMYNSTGRVYPPTVRDFKGALQCTDNGSGQITIEGTDITVPIYSWAETHYLPEAFITPAYKADLFMLTGTTNDRTWRGYVRGEVLFLGASGSVRSSEDWELSFKFAAAPNASDFTVGPVLHVDKEAWEFMWVDYEAKSSAPGQVKQARAVYVERVYNYSDYSLLGLGI